MTLEAKNLDYHVRNVCASFMSSRDAERYIEWRRSSEGPHGPLYEIETSNTGDHTGRYRLVGEPGISQRARDYWGV